MNETAPTSRVAVQLDGGIAPDLADYARTTVGRLLEHRGRAGAPARVHVLRRHGAPRPSSVTARVVVDLDGTTVAAHIEADHAREAVDLVVDRLARRLERLRRPARDGGHGLSGPHLREEVGPA